MDRSTSVGLADRLSGIYTGAIHDVLRVAGLEVRVLPPALRPLDPTRGVAGPAFTVSGHVDTSLNAHETLLAWTEFLSRAPADHVVVCQPNDGTVAHMGELSAETLQGRGVRGYVVDGGCRDTEFILSVGFPVWCRYTTPLDIRVYWVPGSYAETINIDGVRVHSDDYLVADRDGVILIDGDHVTEVTDAAEEALRQEDLVRAAIRRGVSPKDAYVTYGTF